MRLRLHAKQIAPLAAIAVLVGVPAMADTGVPGLPGTPAADPPPPPVPVPQIQVPAPSVPQVQVPAPDTAVQQVASAAQQVQQAAVPTRSAQPAQPAQQAPADAAPRAKAPSAPSAPTVRHSARQATRRATGARAHASSARQVRHRGPSRTRRAHRGHVRVAVAPHPIARALPADVLRRLAAQPPHTPKRRRTAPAHHSKLPFGDAGLPVPSRPVLLLLLGIVGLATLTAVGTMPSGFGNSSLGRRWRRLRRRRLPA